MDARGISWFVDDTVIRKLQPEGVARAERYGGVTREIKVAIDPDRLQRAWRHGRDVNRALARPMPIEQRQRRFRDRNQRPHARRARTVVDPPRSKSRSPAARKVQLSDIAAVIRRMGGTESFARLKHQTVVSFGIFRGKGESDVDVSGRGDAAVAELGRRIRRIQSSRSTTR